MNEDFEHALETLELIEEAAYYAEGTANWAKEAKGKPNLDWYAEKFNELRGMIRNLSSEIWSLAQAYDTGPTPIREPSNEHRENQHDDAKAVHAR